MSAANLHWRSQAAEREALQQKTTDVKQHDTKISDKKNPHERGCGLGCDMKAEASHPQPGYALTKYSVGIILCRPTEKGYEVACVRKRYTYAFADFVQGKYSRRCQRGIALLLSKMTAEELLDIWSLNYNQMWYRVWLDPAAGEGKYGQGTYGQGTYGQGTYGQGTYGQGKYGQDSKTNTAAPPHVKEQSKARRNLAAPQLRAARPASDINHKDKYAKTSAKWHAAFIEPDGGAALRAQVRAAPGKGTLLWEVPKGRPEPGEADVTCAVREVFEETGIAKKEYRIIPGAERYTSHVDAGVRYKCKYYVAIMRGKGQRDLGGLGAARALDRRGEIGEVRWLGLADIRAIERTRVQLSGHLEKLVAPAFRFVKKCMRG